MSLVPVTTAELHQLAQDSADRAVAGAIDGVAEKVRAIVKEELALIGLADSNAGSDVRDLRQIISNWRDIKRRIIVWVVVFVLGAISIVFKPTLVGWLQWLQQHLWWAR